ncbi:MAG: sialate O-acetylesterase [Prevotella sp.]|nr:sialate O-acetylesterase [Paraprevotella sp.]MDY4408132.1 sialate O-acetylesterase [Prevotella sp.]
MKKIFLLLATIMVVMGIKAKVTLPKIFSDGMVMQRETNANLWGEAKASSNVKITTSWDNKSYVVRSDSNGKWKTSVKTPKAGGPFSITFSDGEKLTINNILIGEVWICSGQSNMEMPMKGYKNQPVDNAVEDILHSKDSNLRLFTVKRNSKFKPVDDVTGNWNEANPASVRNFSATAYYFGRELRRSLDVPVGLIVAAWGGSACEAWMTADWLKAFPDAKIPASEEDIKSKNRTPTVLYNGMLHPLIGFSMRGVIWYQGEDNVTRYSTYADMLTTMIGGWRSVWKQGDFPFYFCQIAPYDYKLINYTVNSAFLREQQSKAELMNQNCGMAVLMDVGMDFGIHPRKKYQAGMRLALLALDKTYGVEGLTSESAYYDKMEIKGDTAVISFKRADMWIYGAKGYKSDLFEIAGEDRIFHPAKAWIERSKVYVKCDSVKTPVAVRYAFKDWADGDLFCDGLPISSFRTDNWDE